MATGAAATELDPLFLRAIALLRSRHPDSEKELKQLVQNYREKTYITNFSSSLKKVSDGNGRKSPHMDSRNNAISKFPKTVHNNGKNKSEVLLFEQLEELTNNDESSNQSTKSTRATVESIEEISVGSSLEPKQKKSKSTLSEEIDMSPPSDVEISDSIPIDDIIEMDFDGPSCKVCHLNKRSEEDNSLVECSECHSFFHQKCHKPHVSTKDLNDPRLIWYCSKCTKQMKKEMAAQQQTSSSSKMLPTEPTTPKVVMNPFQQAKPFRRHLSGSTIEKTSSNELTSSTLPDTLLSREDSLSPVNSNKRPRDVTVNSMKRLEMMKKNAKIQHQFKQTRK